jgi:hypothetical protein
MKNKEKPETIEAMRKAFVDVMTKDYTMIERGDLYYLTKMALKYDEISLSKASELLGLPLEDVRVLACEWFGVEETK